MRAEEIVHEIENGMVSLERAFVARAAELAGTRRRYDRLLDEIDRSLDAVADSALRLRLRANLAELEDCYLGVILQLDGLVTRELFDPFRTLAADVLHEIAR